MSQFYGTTQGSRGEATRRGVGRIRSSAQSYTGSVITTMFEEDGEDWCCINVREGSESRPGGEILYRGPIKKLLDQSTRKTMLQFLLDETLLAA